MPGPLSTREKVILGATAAAGLGIGTIVLVKYLQRRKDLQFFRDELARLNRELDEVKKDVRALKGHDQTDRREAVSEEESVSDGEYFDALEELAAATYLLTKPSQSEQNGTIPSPKLEAVIEKVDSLLNSDLSSNREVAYNFMRDAADRIPDASGDCGFLWRFARAAFLYGQSFLNKDEVKRKQLVFEAKDKAFEALDVNERDPDAHKWCALALGTATEFLSMGEKIEKGYDFKVHIDEALNLRPDDPILHHLCGRWCFGVAELSWWERKIAKTLFSDPPTSTYEEALQAFLEAEKLQPNSWAENLLYVGKCYLALNDSQTAIPYLRQCLRVPATGPDDVDAQVQARDLLSKWE